jgi:hypothetical protein
MNKKFKILYLLHFRKIVKTKEDHFWTDLKAHFDYEEVEMAYGYLYD